MKINDQTGCLVENIRAEEILSRRENFSSVADGLDKSFVESVALTRLVVVHYRLAVIASTDNVIDHRDVAEMGDQLFKKLLDSLPQLDERALKGANSCDYRSWL